MLSCPSCGAVMAVTFSSDLSVTAVEKLCSTYRANMVQMHQANCPFRLLAEQCLRQEINEDNESNETSLPTSFAAVFPGDAVELLEHPSPAEILRERVSAIRAMANENSFVFPKIAVPVEFYSQQEDCHPASILDSVVESGVLGTGIGMDSDQKYLIILAVLGWMPTIVRIDESEPTAQAVMSLKCPLCLATMEIPSVAVSNREEQASAHPRKHRRTVARHCNPHDAHRYYCPYVCGFPGTATGHGKPLWKLVMERLRDIPQSHNEVDDLPLANFTRIQGIIKSGIRSQRVQL